MHHVVSVLGRIGIEPELRYTPDGSPVLSFSVACNSTRNDGERKSATLWFRVSVWGKLAEQLADALHKGDTVFASGRFVFDAKTGGPRLFTRKNGETGASFEMTADKVIKISSGGERVQEEFSEEAPF